MKHADRLKQLRSAAQFHADHAADLQSEIQDGHAAEYETRQGFEPGYIAGLTQDHLNDATRLNKKANDLVQRFKP